jgi:hypothetical protein
MPAANNPPVPTGSSVILKLFVVLLLSWNVVASVALGAVAYLAYSYRASLPPVAVNAVDVQTPSAAQPATQEKNGPPSPDSSGNLGPQLEKAMRAIESGSENEQTAATEHVAAMGSKGKPATRALCQALVNATQARRKPFLEALEKVNPTIYEPVVTLFVDDNVNNHVAASGKIADLSDGKDALPIVLKHAEAFIRELETRGRNRNIAGELLTADYNAMRKTAPRDPKVVEMFVRIFKLPVNVRQLREVHELRMAVVETFKDWSQVDPPLKKTLVEMLIEELKRFQQGNASNEYSGQFTEMDTLMTMLAALGKDGKPAVPVLKELKTHSNAQMRKKASTVLDELTKPAQ